MDTLTLNDILELPRLVLETSKKYEEYSELLTDSVVNHYYYSNMRKDLNVFFEKFKEIKYSYHFSFSYYSKVSYEEKVTQSSFNRDPIGNQICNQMDDYLWIENFYQVLLMLSTKLSKQEAVYLVDSFFGHRAESFISDKLGISRMTLQKVKRSCLVKMYLEFQYLK